MDDVSSTIWSGSPVQAALAVHRVVADSAANMTSIMKMTEEAADKGAGLVVFSETALTGFVGKDDPAHDRLLAQPVPGPATAQLGALSRECDVWIAIGLYERLGGAGNERLYDSAILVGPDGGIHLHYRRISPQWHGGDPQVYCQGTDVPMASTPFGTCAFLICGDLFDDELLQRVRRLELNWLLFPFARSYDSEVADAGQREREERLICARRAARAGVGALMVNYLAEPDTPHGCFGGAIAVAPDGAIISDLPPGHEGLLMIDL
ncbi:nitrilase-related carbon-nitrogen hydrolase [Actinopolymorpha rutila]|uniref:N-carbamoylputrescine amidase n=1 Tax=Actinopolymorpha rutila TaxID=446787 RepID=A0A852ZVC7_9ACTN|nr:N-carbamoylputrescine amidase [Actinopolymorpha rutila]